LAAVLLAVCGTALQAQAAEPPARSLLLLHSYQQEYMNILDAEPSGYPEIYSRRLSHRRFDVVIGADNQALTTTRPTC
jgi:hypothetical protein